MRSYDASAAADDRLVSRVTRTLYDPAGRPIHHEIAGRGRSYQECQPPADCSLLEIKGPVLDATYDSAAHGALKTLTLSGEHAVPRSVTFHYDTDGVYPVNVIDPLGFLTTSLMHPAYGVPIHDVDVNGVTTTSKYDSFGRPTKVTQPGTPEVVNLYSIFSSGNRRGIKVDTTVKTGTTANLHERSQVITDELMRPIQRAFIGFDGSWVYDEIVYDHFGNIATQSNPSVAYPPTMLTTHRFDRLGQLLGTKTPDGKTVSTAYSMFQSTTTDQVGDVSFVELDDAGRVKRSGNVGAGFGDVTFTYGPFGQARETKDAEGNKTARHYDALGRLFKIEDPDAGATQYVVDGYGNTIEEERPDGEVIVTTYDEAGRPVLISGDEGDTEYVYDTATNGKRRLAFATSYDDVLTAYTYDSLGRVIATVQNIGATSNAIQRKYDNYGRLQFLFYPTVTGMARFVTQNDYGNGGYLTNIGDATSCNLNPNLAVLPCAKASGIDSLWKVQGRNERLALTSARFGNALTDVREYFPDTGRLKKITAAGIVTNYAYTSDGNLERRWEGNRDEKFVYDDLDRLTDWLLTLSTEAGPTTTTTTYAYSPGGNMKSVKKGATSLFGGTYGANGKPNTLTSVSGTFSGNLTYDELGRQETGLGRTLTWSRNDKPRTITEGAATTTFTYDAFGQRVRKEKPGASTNYFGDLFEHRVAGAAVSDVFYVHGEPGVVAQVEYANAVANKRFLVGDGLSSAIVTMNGATTVSPREYFDPFGKRVNYQGVAIADPDPKTTIGFTGHEEDDAWLVNMGGRIYDRKQYRFLSPDPLIVDPLFTQAYNPFSYAANNPLTYTDPSGYAMELAQPRTTSANPPATTAPPSQGTPPGDTPESSGGPPNGNGQPASTPAPPSSPKSSDRPGAANTAVDFSTAKPAAQGTVEKRWYLNDDAWDPSMGGAASAPSWEGAFDGTSGRGASPLDGQFSTPQQQLEDLRNFGMILGFAFPPVGAAMGLMGLASGAMNGDPLEMVFGLMGAYGTSPLTSALDDVARPAKVLDAAADDVADDILDDLLDECPCFVAGTMVETPNGPVAIETLREGDLVWSRDPDTGETAARPVVSPSHHTSPETITLDLQADDRSVAPIVTTPEHPFWGATGWVMAKDLAAGDVVFSLESGWLRVGSATWAQAEAVVYNFEVAEFHTYFVGDLGAWVHNTCCTTVQKSEFGSYTNTHQSGKTYSGKGGRERSQESGKERAKMHNDPHVATDWTPAPNRREAFKAESRRIDANGGHKSPNNYNEIETQGKRYRREDGEIP